MRGRCLVAALVASVACFAALGASVAVAQTRSVNPQAKTEAAAESPPDLLSGETPDYVPKASAQPAAAPKEVAPTPNATPVVASIRARLAELRKTSSSDDTGRARSLLQRPRRRALDDGHGLLQRGARRHRRDAEGRRLGPVERGLRAAARGRAPGIARRSRRGNEVKLDLAILKYARYAEGGRTDPAKLNKLFGVAPDFAQIRQNGLIELRRRRSTRRLSSLTASEARAVPASASGAAQGPRRERGRRQDRNTQRIIVNMERWRWMPEDLGSLHLWLNVPEFTVYVVKDGKSIYSDKIVVGELKYATPMFSADLQVGRLQSGMDGAADHRQREPAAESCVAAAACSAATPRSSTSMSSR